MAIKSVVGAGTMCAVCWFLSGCQSTPPPRSPNPPGFTQRPASNPALANAPLPPAQPNMNALPTNPANSVANNNGIPTTTSSTAGSQFRSTAQPMPSNNGPAPVNFPSPTPPPAPPPSSNFGSQTSDPAPVAPSNTNFGSGSTLR